MQEKDLFEYAVVRLVPRVEREEFVNVGVILYCKAQKFLRCEFFVCQNKIRFFACDLDSEEVARNLEAIKKICSGDKSGGPIGQLDLASRFRWLTATRSTVVQCSKVHPGYCVSAPEKLHQLLEQLVK